MKTILVIEDEAQTRKVLLNSLQFEGFKAIEADNGKKGLQLARKKHPDLIVCDIMMPEMDGYQVLSALRQQLSTIAIPVIFLTAKVSMVDLRLGMNLGAEDYLTKPCTIERFLTAIKTRLKRKEELQKWHHYCSKVQDSSSLSSQNSVSQNSKVTAVLNFIADNHTRPLELQEIASTMGYSAAYLTDMIRRKTGRTIKQWIIETRMNTARKLLLNTEKSVTQIAQQAGYKDTGYFIRQFKKLHGNTPHSWRNQSQSGH